MVTSANAQNDIVGSRLSPVWQLNSSSAVYIVANVKPTKDWLYSNNPAYSTSSNTQSHAVTVIKTKLLL